MDRGPERYTMDLETSFVAQGWPGLRVLAVLTVSALSRTDRQTETETEGQREREKERTMGEIERIVKGQRGVF
jgi:hypothetical protein